MTVVDAPMKSNLLYKLLPTSVSPEKHRRHVTKTVPPLKCPVVLVTYRSAHRWAVVWVGLSGPHEPDHLHSDLAVPEVCWIEPVALVNEVPDRSAPVEEGLMLRGR